MHPSFPPSASAPAGWPDWVSPPAVFAPAAGAGVPEAMAWLEALAEREAWTPRMRFALSLCADEALANIVSHARSPEGTAPVRLRLLCGATAQGVALCIEDDGVPFDPTAQASPALAASLDDAQVGGHGLRLMRHYLHQMLYRREGAHNRLLLEVVRTDPEARPG